MRCGWISAAAYAHTGYGGQTREIVGRMIQAGYEVYNIGGIGGATVWGGKQDYVSKTHMEQGKKIVDVEIPVLPTYGQLGGEDVAQIFIDRYGLDLIITLWDAFVIHFVGKLSVPAMCYLPVDAPFTPNMYANVRDAYRVIAFSEYGLNELLKWFPPSKVAYIPHGIDTKVFKPLETERDRARVRETLNPPVPNDAFLTIVTAANVGERKMLPFQIMVFKEFHDRHPDSYMYLHTNMKMAYPHGYDLITWADMMGILDYLRFPSVDPIIEPYSDEQLAAIYGASDLYWSMTIGEGFGLGTLEAMACGTPAAITNCSTSPELITGHGWLIDTVPEFTFIPVWIPTLQFYPIPSKKSALACLEEAYRNPEKTKEYGKQSREFTLGYDWSKIMPLWYKLLREVEEELELLKEIKG